MDLAVPTDGDSGNCRRDALAPMCKAGFGAYEISTTVDPLTHEGMSAKSGSEYIKFLIHCLADFALRKEWRENS